MVVLPDSGTGERPNGGLSSPRKVITSLVRISLRVCPSASPLTSFRERCPRLRYPSLRAWGISDCGGRMQQ